MGSKGSQSSNVVTQSNQTYTPAGAPYLTSALGAAANLANQTTPTIPTAPVAGFQPLQQQAFQGYGNLGNIANPFTQQAAQYYSPQGAQQFANPYINDVTAQLQNIFGQQNAQNTANLVQSAGGVGADRIAVGQGNLANQQALAAGQTYANLYSQAQQQAQQAGSNIANLGFGAQQAQQAALAAQLGAGGQQQQLAQQQLQAPYQQQLQQLALPYQLSQWYSSQIGSLAPALGGQSVGSGTSNTVSQYNPSLISDILNIAGPLGGLFARKSGGAVNPFASGGSVPLVDLDAPMFGGASSIVPPSKLTPLRARIPALNLNLTPAQANMMQRAPGLQGLSALVRGLVGGPSWGGGNALTDAYGGSSSNPLPGLSASDYGPGYRRGGRARNPFANVPHFDDGGGTGDGEGGGVSDPGAASNMGVADYGAPGTGGVGGGVGEGAASAPGGGYGGFSPTDAAAGNATAAAMGFGNYGGMAGGFGADANAAATAAIGGVDANGNPTGLGTGMAQGLGNMAVDSNAIGNMFGLDPSSLGPIGMYGQNTDPGQIGNFFTPGNLDSLSYNTPAENVGNFAFAPATFADPTNTIGIDPLSQMTDPTVLAVNQQQQQTPVDLATFNSIYADELAQLAQVSKGSANTGHAPTDQTAPTVAQDQQNVPEFAPPPTLAQNLDYAFQSLPAMVATNPALGEVAANTTPPDQAVTTQVANNPFSFTNDPGTTSGVGPSMSGINPATGGGDALLRLMAAASAPAYGYVPTGYAAPTLPYPGYSVKTPHFGRGGIINPFMQAGGDVADDDQSSPLDDAQWPSGPVGAPSQRLADAIAQLESSGKGVNGPRGRYANELYQQFPAFVKQYGAGADGIMNYARQVLAASPDATFGDLYSGYVTGTGNPADADMDSLRTTTQPGAQGALGNLQRNSPIDPDTPLASLIGDQGAAPAAPGPDVRALALAASQEQAANNTPSAVLAKVAANGMPAQQNAPPPGANPFRLFNSPGLLNGGTLSSVLHDPARLALIMGGMSATTPAGFAGGFSKGLEAGLTNEQAAKRLEEEANYHAGLLSAKKKEQADADSEVSDIADAIESGAQPPSLSALYGKSAAVRAELSRRGVPLAKMQAQWSVMQQQARSLNTPRMIQFQTAASTALNTIDEIKGLSQQLNQGGIGPVNHARLVYLSTVRGNTPEGQLATKYLNAVNFLKEEFTTVANGGFAPTESVWHLARSQINEDFGTKQLEASLGEVQKLLRYRINSIPNIGTLGPGAPNMYTGQLGGQGAQSNKPPVVYQNGHEYHLQSDGSYQ